MVEGILHKILFALEILSLEWQSNDELSVLGAPPHWAQVEFDCFSEPQFSAGEFSPFLENFLIDAQEFWTDQPLSFLRSGLWSEIGQSGQDLQLEAVALYLDGRHILLVESVDSHGLERFRWLQTARQEQLNFISERKAAEAKIIDAKFYDGLTGLANQRFFLAQITDALEKSRVAILVFNLDRFQVVNNSLGHAVGDRLLQAVAERLKQNAGPQSTLARLGSDEFGLLLSAVEPEHEAIALAQRLIHQLRQPFALSSLMSELSKECWNHAEDSLDNILITSSAGITIGDRTTTARELLRDAGIAMHQAKLMERGSAVLFEQTMRTRAFELWQLETDLHRALQAEELQVWYQPIVSLQTHRITSFEALLRWHHPKKGWISPHRFIPLAEESGLILELDIWVLKQASKAIHRWQSLTEQPLSLNVNLSSRQLGEADLLDRVQQAIARTQVQPSQINLEITESFLLTDSALAAQQLQRLRQMGFTISIDDFGTGYASFSYLQDLPVEKLKIDGYFIDVMLESGSEIVDTIIQLAHSLGIDVTAERVETAEQYAVLEALGCDYAQGYYMAKPLPSDQAIALVNHTFGG